MTEIKTDTLKSYATIANLVLLVGFIVHQAKWQEKVDNRIENLERHSKNEIMHMPFEQKIKVFVPRTEIDGRLSRMESDLAEIKSDLKKLHK